MFVWSAEVGVAVVVGMGGEDDDMEARRVRRGSGEGGSVEVAILWRRCRIYSMVNGERSVLLLYEKLLDKHFTNHHGPSRTRYWSVHSSLGYNYKQPEYGTS